MPKEPFARYDSADYLNSEDAIATYLEVVRDEAGDDPAILAHALEVIARARTMHGLTGPSQRSIQKTQ